MADPFTIGMIATAAGTILSTGSQLIAAKNAQSVANMNADNTRRVSKYNADLANQAAGQEEAASQLAAAESKRQSRLKQSRVLALAAASGGGAMDQDVMNIIAGFEEEGDLDARTNLYQGSEAARKYRAQGQAGIWQGESQARATQYQGAINSASLKRQAAGTIMGGASSLAFKYAGK